MDSPEGETPQTEMTLQKSQNRLVLCWFWAG